MGPEKTQDLLKGWKPMSCKGQVQKIKSWLKNQRILSEEQKKELSQKKQNSPVEALQASKCKNTPQQVPKKGKKKEKYKRKKPYPQNYRIPKKEKKDMDNVFNMARTSMEFKYKEEERMNQSFPNE
ncbi:hypothetical protein O181_108271 [Austropuccinia psidii MF-1]|uniref:Uncharacterized protein n=1 Tax=Austropuccinia psidii MF-1 TaxID=1389203 RepID=A0A9Q3JUZ9_9BASI|nr:hypothetical protein [Austropuccinia psidii MF-1]